MKRLSRKDSINQCSRIARVNQEIPSNYKILSGEIVGSVGESGIATGAHLHLEIRDGGNPINPIEYLRGR